MPLHQFRLLKYLNCLAVAMLLLSVLVSISNQYLPQPNTSVSETICSTFDAVDDVQHIDKVDVIEVSVPVSFVTLSPQSIIKVFSGSAIPSVQDRAPPRQINRVI